MKIIHTSGDLFLSGADALINACNTKGIMGAGIALEFKNRYPLYFYTYKKACREGNMRVGKVHVYRHGEYPRYIISFPTKDHYKDSSLLTYIESGMKSLVKCVNTVGDIKSVAVPPLGCGLGGLSWKDVEPLIVSELENIETNTIFYIYEPWG